MIGLRMRNAALCAVAAFLALSMSVPAAARSNPSPAVSSTQEISIARAPEAFTTPTRKRAEASRLRRPCQKVAVYTPMLFIGVGW